MRIADKIQELLWTKRYSFGFGPPVSMLWLRVVEHCPAYDDYYEDR